MPNGYKLITKYETCDGVIHDSIENAKRHNEIRICDGIRFLLNQHNFLTSTDKVSITNNLYDNRCFLRNLLELEDYGDDDDDDDDDEVE